MIPGIVRGNITLLLAFLGCTENLLVVVVVATKRRLHTMHFFLLANLSLSDSVFNISTTFVGVSQISEEWIFGETWCKATSYLLRCFTLTTIILLCAVTWECHTAVVKPYQFRNDITLEKVTAVVLLWIASLVFGAAQFFSGTGGFTYNDKMYHCERRYISYNGTIIREFVSIFIFYVIPFGLMGKQQYQINRIAKHQKTKIAQQQLVVNPKSHEGHQHQRFMQNIKESKDALLIVTAFLVSYLPLFVSRCLRVLLAESDALYNTWFLAMALTQVGSTWNPIIHCFRKRAFRREFFKFLNLNTSTVSPLIQMNQSQK